MELLSLTHSCTNEYDLCRTTCLSFSSCTAIVYGLWSILQSIQKACVTHIFHSFKTSWMSTDAQIKFVSMLSVITCTALMIYGPGLKTKWTTYSAMLKAWLRFFSVLHQIFFCWLIYQSTTSHWNISAANKGINEVMWKVFSCKTLWKRSVTLPMKIFSVLQ